MRKFQLEMGGKNPMVVLDDADLEVAVEACLNGAFYSTGQRCTASSRLIVTDGIHDRFVAAARPSGWRRSRSATRSTPGPRSARSSTRASSTRTSDYIEHRPATRAPSSCGGERLKRDTEGFFLAPALFVGATNAMRISREEIFGPVASVIRVKDYDEALAVANDTEFGLSAGICTTSLKYATHFKRNAEAGMVMVNLPTAGVDFHVPFGGAQGLELRPARAGPLRGGVLHHGQDRLHRWPDAWQAASASGSAAGSSSRGAAASIPTASPRSASSNTPAAT